MAQPIAGPIRLVAHSARVTAALGLVCLSLAAAAAAQNDRSPRCVANGATATLSNVALAVTFDIADGHIRPARLDNRLTGVDATLQGELFELKRRDGVILRASDFHFEAPIRCVVVAGTVGAARQAARSSEQAAEATLVQNGGGLTIAWRASINGDGSYVRESFLLTAASDVDIAGVSLISLHLPGASIAGTADGSPIVSGDAFFAFEHPMARARRAALASSLQKPCMAARPRGSLTRPT